MKPNMGGVAEFKFYEHAGRKPISLVTILRDPSHINIVGVGLDLARAGDKAAPNTKTVAGYDKVCSNVRRSKNLQG
jgi:hypothetical protein